MILLAAVIARAGRMPPNKHILDSLPFISRGASVISTWYRFVLVSLRVYFKMRAEFIHIHFTLLHRTFDYFKTLAFSISR